jgi:hypothetical protein
MIVVRPLPRSPVPQRFELTPRNLHYSDAELLADMRRVARQLGASSLGRKRYTALGRFDGDNIAKRFGGWRNALKKAGLASPQPPPVTDQQLLDDLRTAASKVATTTLALEQYKSVGSFSEHPFREHFGSWSEAVRRAGLAPPAGYRARASNEDYFRNLERLWVTLGRQPRYMEVEKPLSDFSMKAYEHRFGSWRKALEAFVEFVNQTEEPPPPSGPGAASEPVSPATAAPRRSRSRARQRTNRAPSHRLRFVVMKRDDFKCRLCGRSPALDHKVVLHVDHIVPWDAGGETLLDNLQTLCDTCNLGKGNLNP